MLRVSGIDTVSIGVLLGSMFPRLFFSFPSLVDPCTCHMGLRAESNPRGSMYPIIRYLGLG